MSRQPTAAELRTALDEVAELRRVVAAQERQIDAGAAKLAELVTANGDLRAEARRWEDAAARASHMYVEAEAARRHLAKHAERLELLVAGLEREVVTDDPTGVYNRRWLRREGADALSGLVFVDLDRFKAINTAYTHRGGDQVIAEVAARLAEIGPTVRLGGDEFALVVRDGDVGSAAWRAEYVIAIAPVRLVDGTEVKVTASVGYALAGGEPVDVVLERADLALWHAKHCEQPECCPPLGPVCWLPELGRPGNQPAGNRRYRDAPREVCP